MPNNHRESYYYKVRMTYVNTRHQEIEIDSNQIQYVLIDKDYDNINMPVISVFGSIEKNIIDDMIRNSDNNIINFGIYKYDKTNQSDGITEQYFYDRFIYILNEDLSKTNKLDYEEFQDDNTGNTLYRDVNIYLLQQDAVNNNSQVINGIYKDASMNSLILQASNFLGNTLLEPIQYDTKYKQVVIPPVDSVSEYIKFLNDHIGVFYDTPYRFFIDFDCTYIVSSSGNATGAKNQYMQTIVININEVDSRDLQPLAQEQGAIVDTRAKKYTIDVNVSDVEYTRNHVVNKLVNKITVVDADGNKREQDIKPNKANITKEINRIYNVSNTDENVINNISSTIDSSNVMITIIKNDLNASLFTLNKEYIINDPLHEESSGRYILISNKQLIQSQATNFVLTTVLTFRKVYDKEDSQ